MMTLRTANEGDQKSLFNLYRNQNEKFLLPRPENEFTAAIHRGQYFLIEENNQILAASGVFDYSENEPFVELAETYVSPTIRGYGLQELFFHIRIASVVLFQGPSVQITTAIDPKNDRSLTNMNKQGFTKWSPIPEAYLSCRSCPNKPSKWTIIFCNPRKCCCDYYVLPVDQSRIAVSNLLMAFQNGSIRLQSREGQVKNLQVTCRILLKPELRLSLHEFAQGDSW